MVARLPEAPSFPAQGMLGQVGAWWVLNRGCLRGRVGSPLGEEGWSRLRPPSPCTSPDPQNSPLPCYTLIFIPTLNHQ